MCVSVPVATGVKPVGRPRLTPPARPLSSGRAAGPVSCCGPSVAAGRQLLAVGDGVAVPDGVAPSEGVAPGDGTASGAITGILASASTAF